MLKIYRVYLASSLVLPLMASTVFFVLFLLSFQLLKVMRLVSTSDLELGFILQLIGNMALTLVPMALPISVFFSVIYCVSRICSDSEFVALRSFGLAKSKILLPFLFIAAILALNTYWLNQKLVPNAHRDLRKDIKILSSVSLIEGIKSGQFFTNIPNITMFTERVDEETRQLSGVFLHIFNTSTQEEKIIKSKSGRIIHSKDEATGLEIFKLLLFQGNILSKNPKGELEKIIFKEYDLPISSQKFSYTPSTKENMMTGDELKNFIDTEFKVLSEEGFSRKNYLNAIYQYWNRVNSAFLIFTLSFLGFALSVKGNRGRSSSNSKAIFALIAYYAIFFAFISMGKSEKIPMVAAVFVPNILLTIYAAYLYRKLDWQS